MCFGVRKSSGRDELRIQCKVHSISIPNAAAFMELHVSVVNVKTLMQATHIKLRKELGEMGGIAAKVMPYMYLYQWWHRDSRRRGHRSPSNQATKTYPARIHIHIRIRIGSFIHSFSHLHTQFIHTPEEQKVLPFITWAWLNRKYKTGQGQGGGTRKGPKERLKGPTRIPGPHWISSEMNSCSYPATELTRHSQKIHIHWKWKLIITFSFFCNGYIGFFLWFKFWSKILNF